MTIPFFFLVIILICAFMWGFTYRKRLDNVEIEQRAKDLIDDKLEELENEERRRN